MEFRLVEKCQARFIKKISQLQSDLRSCRCKNFSLKVVSVRSDGGWGVWTPRTLPLYPPLICHFIMIQLSYLYRFAGFLVQAILLWLHVVNRRRSIQHAVRHVVCLCDRLATSFPGSLF